MVQGNILVVDDTPANLDVLTAMLSDHNYKVRPAINGSIALSSARAYPPDLVLLDINMPDINGYEVCQELKSDEALTDIPVIFISAMDETLDKVRAFEVGGVDYITKPFEVEEVLVRVESQLTLYRQRLELEAMRQKDREQYEELNNMKDQFLYSVTHDIKNPLAVINLYSGLLQGIPQLDDDEKASEYIMRIQEASQQVRDLVTDVLELARIGTGVSPTRSAVPVNNLLETSIENFEGLASRKSISLYADLSEQNPEIMIDPRRLMQIVNNLISNAIKYTGQGGQVEVVSRLDNEYVIIEVSDNGLGIPNDDLPYIFDKFYRVELDEYVASEGTGLGLAIVKAIIDNHRGVIAVDSSVGVGTTFTIRLPRSN